MGAFFGHVKEVSALGMMVRHVVMFNLVSDLDESLERGSIAC